MVCKVPDDYSQGVTVTRAHARRCPGFKVTGKIERGMVQGICNKCKIVLENHGKQGKRWYRHKDDI